MSDLIDRDETIKQFCKQDCGCDPRDCLDKTCYEVEIIESVPTHPTPSNTLDISVCVDKQAVIDEINRLINEKHHIKIGTSTFRDGVIDGYARVLSMVKRWPSVQTETAKRIVGKSRDGMTLWYQCDMCNEPVDMQDNYCRGCGRRLIDE